MNIPHLTVGFLNEVMTLYPTDYAAQLLEFYEWGAETFCEVGEMVQTEVTPEAIQGISFFLKGVEIGILYLDGKTQYITRKVDYAFNGHYYYDTDNGEQHLNDTLEKSKKEFNYFLFNT